MSGISQSEPLIIEVRANEFASREHNPHVPYGAEAMIADALACGAAGASGYHWHTRGVDGIDRPSDVALQVSVMAGIRRHSGMLLHPSFGFSTTQGDAASRVDNLREMISAGQRPDIVPVDFGAFVADPFDPTTGFESGGAVVLNRTGYLGDLTAGISALGVPILAVVWSPGGIRTALRLRESGALTSPVFWQLGFTGPRIPGGPPATVRQLDAFLDELPHGEPWNVHVRDGDGLAMAVEAIQRGGHVAIGLGDDPYERLGRPSNADLVRRVTAVAETVGRSVATPSDARRILGWPGQPSVDDSGVETAMSVAV